MRLAGRRRSALVRKFVAAEQEHAVVDRMTVSRTPVLTFLSVAALLSSSIVTTAPAAEPPPSSHWVFVGTYTGAVSKGVYVSRLDDDGTLIQPQLAAETTNPAFLAVDPRGRFLYAANEVGSFKGESAGSVAAYRIDAATGALTQLNQVSTVTSGPCHVSVDTSGAVVFAANYGGGSVQSYLVQPDGSLSAAVSVIRQEGSSVNPERQREPHGHWAGVDPTNRFALLCDLGLDQVLVFRLDVATATLTPHELPFARVKPGAGPRHGAFGHDGRFFYLINELDCTMTVFAFDAERGALNEVQMISTLPPGETVQPGFSTAEVALHPSGRFLYGSNRGHNSLVVYAIDPTSGRLSLVEHVSSGGERPRSFGIDPSGRYLLSANQDTNNVVVMRIDPSSGRLTPTNASITVEKPVSVAFAPVQ